MNVTGTVTLTNATLNLFALNPAVLPVGAEMVLISNDGADPIVGEFTGFPEGHIFTNGLGEGNLLSYKGGDGNDISLTHIVVPPV